MVDQALSGQEAAGVRKDEMEAVVKVFLLGVHRTGSEDLRDMLRKVSDPLLEHIVKNMDTISLSPVLGKIGQFFVIEWCYRNDYLMDDWSWEWEGRDGGKANFLPRMPLDSVPLPQRDRPQ